MSTVSWRGKLRIEAVSPLHVGTGERLAPWLEYDFRNGQWARLDMEAFLADRSVGLQVKEQLFSGQLDKQTKARLISKIPARYTLIAVNGDRTSKEVREAIKLPGDIPYLPATSVKGAIRTALAAVFIKYLLEPTKRQKALEAAAEKNKKFKAQKLEDELFRGGVHDAKLDVLKGLIIRDSGPIPRLELRLYNLCTSREGELVPDQRRPFALEAIPIGTAVEIEIQFREDQLRLEENYRPNQKAVNCLKRVDQLKNYINVFCDRVIECETKFYQASGKPQIADFFNQPDLLPIGFGTGWNAKTIGTLLSPEEIKQANIKFPYGSPPPISRRLAMDKNGQYTLPLGWARVSLEVL